MIILFGLLTVVLVLLSLFLILLVLVQLPKKDAGTGIAFGGAAADALFGAGSGNVLTKVTKYSIISFFVVVIVLGILHDHLNAGPDASEFSKKVAAAAAQQAAMNPAPAPVAPHPAATPATNSMQLLSAPTPAPATPATKN